MSVKITASMVQRYESKRFGFNDPCVVCGGNYNICGHDENASEVITRIRKLGAEGRKRILNTEEPEHEGIWGELEFRPEGYFYFERTKGSEYWPFNVIVDAKPENTVYEIRELTGDTPIGEVTCVEDNGFKATVNGVEIPGVFAHLRPAAIHIAEEYNGC